MAWRFLTRLSFVLIALGAIPLVLAANKKPPAAPINLNTATSEELQQVPGIGPVTAEKILQMRKAYGPFKSVDDVRAIKGIGPKRLEKMRKYLTVGKTPAAKKTPATENISPRLNLAAPPDQGGMDSERRILFGVVRPKADHAPSCQVESLAVLEHKGLLKAAGLHRSVNRDGSMTSDRENAVVNDN